MRISGLGSRYCRYQLENGVRLHRASSVMEEEGRVGSLGRVEAAVPQEDILLNLEKIPERLPVSEIQMREVPYYRFREKKAWLVKDARLFGRDAFASVDGRIILESVYYSEPYLMRFLPVNLYTAPKWVLGALHPFQRTVPWPEVEKIDSAMVLHGRWHNNYYHWATEHLLKLRAAERYREERGELPLLIIPPNPAEYMLDSLERMGYGKAEMRPWWLSGAEVSQLVVSSYPEVTPDSLHWLRSRMLSPDDEPQKSERGLRLYVSRRDAAHRRVKNEAELEPLLKEHGFQVFVPSEHSLEEQIRLFRRAEMVVGPHGAGLTNLVWGDDLKVIELFGEEIRFHYTHISRLLGFDYRALACRPAGQHEDLIVDLNVLEKEIAASLE